MNTLALILKCLGIYFLLGTTACTLLEKKEPTLILQSPQQEKSRVDEEAGNTKGVVYLDARSELDFEMLRVPGSQLIRPRDFTKSKDPKKERKGFELDTDFDFHTRYLSRLGIDPEKSKVVVIADSTKVKDVVSAGFIAWMLKAYGVSDVSLKPLDDFNLTAQSFEVGDKLRPKPILAGRWKKLSSPLNYECDHGEFFKDLEKRFSKDPSPHQKAMDFIVLDVRQEAEYLGKLSQGLKDIDFGSINVPLSEFYSSKLEVNKDLIERLKAIGAENNTAIYVLSSFGDESAAASFALIQAGFTRVCNFSSGLVSLKK